MTAPVSLDVVLQDAGSRRYWRVNKESKPARCLVPINGHDISRKVCLHKANRKVWGGSYCSKNDSP